MQHAYTLTIERVALQPKRKQAVTYRVYLISAVCCFPCVDKFGSLEPRLVEELTAGIQAQFLAT